MNVSTEVYEQSNSLQTRNAIRLFNEIKQLDRCDRYSLIVDIGSGPGSSTLLFSKWFDCDKVIGLDCDANMVNLSREKVRSADCGQTEFEFTECDVQLQPDQLLRRINVEGNSADMVVSIYCLHWVQDQETAMKNISALLTTGGRAHLLFYSFCLISRFVDQFIERSQWAHLFPAIKANYDTTPPCERERLQRWHDMSERNGLSVVKSYVVKDFYAFEREEFLNHAELQFGLKKVPQTVTSDYPEFVRQCRAFFNKMIDDKIDLYGFRVDDNDNVVVEVQSIRLALEKDGNCVRNRA